MTDQVLPFTLVEGYELARRFRPLSPCCHAPVQESTDWDSEVLEAFDIASTDGTFTYRRYEVGEGTRDDTEARLWCVDCGTPVEIDGMLEVT